MRDAIHIWRSKEVKLFRERVEEQWGCEWEPDGALIANTKGDVFLVTRDLAKIAWEKLRISSVGLYIAEYRYEEGRIRLSIEGSQLIGPLAKKNVVDVDKDEAMRWMKGHDLDVQERSAKEPFQGHVIVRCGKDFMGTGAYKDGKLLNHVPKARRLPEQA